MRRYSYSIDSTAPSSASRPGGCALSFFGFGRRAAGSLFLTNELRGPVPAAVEKSFATAGEPALPSKGRGGRTARKGASPEKRLERRAPQAGVGQIRKAGPAVQGFESVPAAVSKGRKSRKGSLKRLPMASSIGVGKPSPKDRDTADHGPCSAEREGSTPSFRPSFQPRGTRDARKGNKFFPFSLTGDGRAAASLSQEKRAWRNWVHPLTRIPAPFAAVTKANMTACAASAKSTRKISNERNAIDAGASILVSICERPRGWVSYTFLRLCLRQPTPVYRAMCSSGFQSEGEPSCTRRAKTRQPS